MEKSLNPDITLHKDIQFLDRKLDKIKGMFTFSPELKDYMIASHYINLSNAITTLINHHTADLDISSLCDSHTTEAEIMINSPGYTKISENQNNVNKFFSNQQDLFRACYRFTQEAITDEAHVSCYAQLKRDHSAMGINICDPPIEKTMLLHS